jgi:hypothetical protein
LGLNRVEIDPQPGIVYGPGGQAAPREKWFDQLVAQAQEGHLFMATSPSRSTPWFQNWTRQDPAARAVNVQGEPVRDARWSDTYSLCPLYQGKMFQKHLQMFTNGAAFNKYRVSWLALDLELWTDEAWKEGCFCERCLAAFQEYKEEKHPQERIGDPRQFMSDPAAHPRERQVWQDFREWCLSEMIRAFRGPLEEIVAQHGGQTSPRPGLAVSEWRGPSPALFDVVDYFEISLYRKPAEVARRLGAALQGAEGRKNIMGTPSTGQTYGLDTNLTAEDLRYSIFECAAAGVQGMIWYEVMGLDALKLKTLVEGLRTIQPFEDLILEGQCQTDWPCEGETASARGITRGPEALVLVRSYQGPPKVQAKVTLPVREKSAVYDCYTRQALGAVTPKKPRMVVPISRERARLLYVGPEASWKKRY